MCVCMYIWQAAVLSKGIHQVENASDLVALAKSFTQLSYPVLPALRTRM